MATNMLEKDRQLPLLAWNVSEAVRVFSSYSSRKLPPLMIA